MATADVTVMGGGIFGLSIAYECARRGAAVAVIDPRGPGGGSSGGVVGALAPHTPEQWEPKKEFQLDSLLMATGFWAAVDDCSGCSCGYGRVGRLQPIPDERALVLARQRADQADKLWRGAAKWRIRPVADFAGWAPHSSTGLLVHDTLSARIDPRRACASLAGALVALGGQVQTDGAPGGAVIWATGYEGLLQLSEEFGQQVGNGVKGQSVLLRYPRPSAPQVFADGIHYVAHDDGTLAIGSTSERYFDEPFATDGQLDALLLRALDAMPQLLNATVIARWAGVRPRASTRAPMLGRYPGRDGHYIANGGFKIGFAMAPKVASVMADLVLEGINGVVQEFAVEANLRY